MQSVADDIVLNPGSGGASVAADLIGGVYYPRSKIVLGADGENDGDVSEANPIPVSGTVTASLSATDNEVLDAIAASLAGTLIVGSHAVTNAGTFAVQAAQSGTWNITNVSGTVSLPTGAATAAKQPALGTAGTASADVLSVQGIASMTPLLVNGSGVTQPVSGTVTAELSATDNAVLDAIAASLAGTLTVGSHAVTNAGTFLVQAAQSGTWNVTNILGTISLPTGASTAANQSTIIGHLDGVEGLLTTIDGDTGSLAGCVGGTELQVDIVSSALPTGAATSANQSTANTALSAIQTATQLLDDAVYVDDADWTDSTSKHLLVGGLYQSTPQSITDGDVGPLQVTQNGYLIVSVNGTLTVASHAVTNAGTFAVQAAQSGTWNITNVSGTVSLPTGAATAANQSTANTALSAIQTAVQLIDNAISGNEMQVDVVAALPAGTNTIGVVMDERVSTPSLSNVSGSTSSVQLLASTAGRKAAYFHNDSTSVAYVKFGTTASTTSYTVKMNPDAFYEIPQPVYTGRIDAIWASATGAMRITELT